MGTSATDVGEDLICVVERIFFDGRRRLIGAEMKHEPDTRLWTPGAKSKLQLLPDFLTNHIHSCLYHNIQTLFTWELHPLFVWTTGQGETQGKSTQLTTGANSQGRQCGKLTQKEILYSHRLYMKPLAGMNKQDRDEININQNTRTQKL